MIWFLVLVVFLYCRYTYLFVLHCCLLLLSGHCKRYRAGVDVGVTPPTGRPVGHPPNPATLCDRSAQGSKSWHSWSFAKYSDIGAQGHRITSLVHDMHTRRTRPDYLQACPTGPPVDGVKSILTPALWPCAALWPCTFCICSDPFTRQ